MMKNQYKILSIMLAGGLLTACSSEEPAAGSGDRLTAAHITAGISTQASRAVGSEWEADDIGVTVTDAPNSNMAQLYRNVRYKTNATASSADFFPAGEDNDGIFFQDATETVTFSAYGPYRDWAVASGEDGFNIVDMADSQMGREAQKSVDFIHASGATASNATPTVTFTGENAFRHVMSRLVVVIKTDDSGDFSPNAVTDGSYILGGMKLQALFNPYTGEAKASDAPAVDDWYLNFLPSATTDNGGICYTAILPPQTLPKALSFSASVDGQTYRNDKSIKPALESSKSYQYTITVRKTGLIVSGCTITDWNNDNSESFNGEATMPVSARRGDFFYSDGTYSTRFNPDKTCIGIVFWTPADANAAPDALTPASLTDDKIMAAEHPECTHGLVVSLRDVATGINWQNTAFRITENFQNTEHFNPENKDDYRPVTSGYGETDGVNYVQGYQNTKVLQLFNRWASEDYYVNPIHYIEEFAASNPAPDNTTGWYLPSVKELFLLLRKDADNIRNLNTEIHDRETEETLAYINNLLVIAGGDALTENLWSSTDYLDSELEAAYLIFFERDYGLTGVFYKDTTYEAVRPVLAF